MRFLTRSLSGLFLLAVTLGILALAGKTMFDAVQERMAAGDRQRPVRERVQAVTTVVAEPTNIAPVLKSFGDVRSRRTLDLRAAVGGTLIELADGFEEGGKVTEGQLLARIDPADAADALNVAQTDLSEAQASLAEAERALVIAQDDLASAREQADLRDAALERARELLDRGAGTNSAVENAELAASSAKQAVLSRRQALANAESAVDRARTTLARQNINLDEAKRRLADTEIYADFSGTLTQVTAVEGGLVTNNERIAQIIDTDALEVSFRVSTGQYARLIDQNGNLMPAEVGISLENTGLNLETTGRISRESGSVGDGQTGRLLFARIDQSKGFRPGDFVTVKIQEPELRNVVVLPAAALGSDNSILYVDDENRLHSQPVDLLRRQDETVVLQARGLAGRTIVSERNPALGEGILVRPLEAREAHSATGGVPQAAADQPAAPDMIELTDERRAKLIEMVEANTRMPADARERILTQLKANKVPARMVERLESRTGG